MLTIQGASILQLLLLFKIGLSDFFKTFSTFQKVDLFARDTDRPVQLTIYKGVHLENISPEILNDTLTETKLENASIRCYRQADFFRKDSTRHSQIMNGILKILRGSISLGSSETRDENFVKMELHLKDSIDKMRGFLSRNDFQKLTAEEERERERESQQDYVEKIFDYSVFTEDNFERDSEDAVYKLPKQYSFLAGENGMQAKLSAGYRSMTEKLEDIYDRIRKKLYGKCFEKKDTHSKFCLFTEIKIDDKIYVIKESEVTKNDFSISNFDQLSLMLTYKRLDNKNLFSELEEYYHIYLVCGVNRDLVNLGGNEAILHTPAACIKNNTMEFSYKYKETYPKGVIEFLEHHHLGNVCDVFKKNERDYIYCEDSGFFTVNKKTDRKTFFGFADQKQKMKNPKLVKVGDDSKSSFFSFDLITGSYCREGNRSEFYKTKVVYICFNHEILRENLRILSVEKTGSCSFVVKVGVPNLCRHEFFKKKEKAIEVACLYNEEYLY